MNALVADTPVTTSTDRVFRDGLAGDDLRELVPNPRLIIDAGAGGGGFSRNARSVWPEARIISYEPADRFNLSLKAVDANHSIRRVALGSRNGIVTLNITHGPESNSLLGYLENGPLSKLHQVVGHSTVHESRLDDALLPEERAQVDVLKLDVQGAELMVLDGAVDVLRNRPVIYTEVSFQPLYAGHPLVDEVDAYLTTRGYRRLYLYASPMPDLWGDAIYIPDDRIRIPIDTSRATIKLNIGAGNDKLPGYTPVDRKFGDEAFPLKYPDNSVDEILCSHMLEHLSYAEVHQALPEWFRVLKPGGKLRISVPDLDKVSAILGKDPVAHFYLYGGQTDENDYHKSGYNEGILAAHLNKFGFVNIDHWTPDFDGTATNPISLNVQAEKPVGAGASLQSIPSDSAVDIKIRAVIGMPRIGWNDSWQSICDAVRPFGIPVETHQGCFWGQNMQNALSRALRDGIDWVITLDYDSVILPMHVARLLEILGSHPEIDAIAALQMRRGAETPLFSTGKTEAEIDGSPIKVNTAHFGLTALRVECLRSMKKPWLIDVADDEGEFSGGHTDADITFWKKWTEVGNSVYVAPDVRIGHLELLVSEFDENFKPVHRHIGDWWNHHAKLGHCMRTKKEI